MAHPRHDQKNEISFSEKFVLFSLCQTAVLKRNGIRHSDIWEILNSQGFTNPLLSILKNVEKGNENEE